VSTSVYSGIVSGLILLTFLLSFSGTYLIRKIATKRNILDVPNKRSSHNQPVPRGGGLAIAIAWYVAIITLFLFKEIQSNLFFALLCSVPVATIGLLDDVLNISPKIRLVVQVLSSALAVYFLGGLKSIDLGFVILHNSTFFSLAAILGIVWFTNLFNFLDGIDGFVSLEIIFISFAAFFILGLKLPLFLAAATIGFLLWNWQPAKIFMGDVGSTMLGFTVGIFTIYYQNTNESSFVIWLLFSSLFWFDATITLFRRWRNHEKLSVAHRKHAYQRMVQFGYSHQKTVICSGVINLTIMALAWLAVSNPNFLLPLFAINIIYLYILIRLIDKRFPFSK
jgi:Fuc2NAc and GlcNAc transferase